MHANRQFKIAFRFPENFLEAKITEMNEETTLLKTKESTRFSLGAFRGELLFHGSLDFAAKNINVHITDTVLRAICLQLFARVALLDINKENCTFLLHRFPG